MKPLLLLALAILAGCATEPLTYEQQMAITAVGRGLQDGADTYARATYYNPPPVFYPQPAYQPPPIIIPPATLIPR